MNPIAALLMLAAPPADADTLDCESPKAQIELNLCSLRVYQMADAELNARWTKTLAEVRRLDGLTRTGYPTPTYEQTLLAAQRAWLAYRDAQCALMSMEYRDGSAQPMAHSDCMAELTKARTIVLRDLVEMLG